MSLQKVLGFGCVNGISQNSVQSQSEISVCEREDEETKRKKAWLFQIYKGSGKEIRGCIFASVTALPIQSQLEIFLNEFQVP